MKKNAVIAGSVTLLVFLVFLAVWLIQPDLSVFDSLSVSKQAVDTSEDIVLELGNAVVSVNEWGKDYVEITYDNVVGKKRTLDISKVGNRITLNSNLDFTGSRHISVNVPKSVICLSAKKVSSKGGTFRMVKAEEANLRYCTFADGFTSEGASIEVREGRFQGGCQIRNETVAIRECDAVDMTLYPMAAGKAVKANLRELHGVSLHLDAGEAPEQIAELKDSDLELFSVDYAGEKGNITVFAGSVKKIDNRSKLEIHHKKSVTDLS